MNGNLASHWRGRKLTRIPTPAPTCITGRGKTVPGEKEGNGQRGKKRKYMFDERKKRCIVGGSKKRGNEQKQEDNNNKKKYM